MRIEPLIHVFELLKTARKELDSVWVEDKASSGAIALSEAKNKISYAMTQIQNLEIP